MRKKSILASKRRALYAVFMILIVFVSIHACRKSSLDNSINSFTKDNYSTELHRIDYKSEILDSILRFKLQIYKKSSGVQELNETFEFDLRKGLGENVYDVLVDRSSQSQYDDLPPAEIKAVCKSLKTMINESTKRLSNKEVLDPKVQGMYIGLSFVRRILNNKLISYNSSKKANLQRTSSTEDDPEPGDDDDYVPYEQDVYEGYLRGMSSYIANEDIIINKAVLQSIISRDLIAVSGDTRGLYVFQDVLDGISTPTLTLKAFLGALDIYRAAHPELNSLVGWWPNGSSHGCCGNYNGPCYYWHPVCYVHDKICRKCKPSWFCFSGCVPDPDEDPTDEPDGIYFVEDDPNTGTIVLEMPSTYVPVAYYLNNLSLYDPESEPSDTPIYFNSSNGKYYSDSSYTNLLIDAYYFIDAYTSGKYYKLVGGKVTKVGFVMSN